MNLAKLVSVPNPNYTLLRQVCKDTLGLETSTQRDELCSALGLLEKWDGLSLSHFSFSVLCCTTRDTLTLSVNHTSLQHLTAERIDGFWLAYVSGTLEDWREAVTHCTQLDKPTPLRSLYSAVFAELRPYFPTTVRQNVKLIT